MRPATFETRIAATPLWLRLRDTYTGRPPAAVDVVLERRSGTEWIPLDVAHQISSRGDVGFVNLGRGRLGATGTFDVRVTCTAPGTIAETSSGAATLETTVPVWTDQAPPSPTVETVSFFPAPDYSFGPATPVLAGRVVDGAGSPVPRARVSVTEIVVATSLVEEARTSDDGWFRLPLRWSRGTTQIDAESGARTGAITIVVPDDLRSVPTLTVT